MPSTKEDRYVSTALSLRTLYKKSTASSIPLLLAPASSSSRFCLLVLKPFALNHLDDGGLNLKPAKVSDGINRNPSVLHSAHLLGLAKGSPFFFVLRT